MKSKPEIVFKALMAGMHIHFGSLTFKLFVAGEEVPLPYGNMRVKDSPWLGILWTENNKPAYTGADLDVAFLIRWADKMSDDDIAVIAANLTLRDVAGHLHGHQR